MGIYYVSTEEFNRVVGGVRVKTGKDTVHIGNDTLSKLLSGPLQDENRSKQYEELKEKYKLLSESHSVLFKEYDTLEKAAKKLLMKIAKHGSHFESSLCKEFLKKHYHIYFGEKE
jgi:hypothetical protein